MLYISLFIRFYHTVSYVFISYNPEFVRIFFRSTKCYLSYLLTNVLKIINIIKIKELKSKSHYFCSSEILILFSVFSSKFLPRPSIFDRTSAVSTEWTNIQVVLAELIEDIKEITIIKTLMYICRLFSF